MAPLTPNVCVRVLGAAVPFVQIPVASGRDLAILVEVAVRVQLLREDGHRAPERLATELERRLEGASPRPPR